MHVLVVDDDPMARGLVARFVRLAGHTVVAEAGDGAEALRLASRSPVDAVITDCQMPHLDGISLTRQLRAQGHDAVIVMVSGQSDRSLIDAALSAGVDQYLLKPVDHRKLLAALGAAARAVA